MGSASKPMIFCMSFKECEMHQIVGFIFFFIALTHFLRGSEHTDGGVKNIKWSMSGLVAPIRLQDGEFGNLRAGKKAEKQPNGWCDRGAAPVLLNL